MIWLLEPWHDSTSEHLVLLEAGCRALAAMRDRDGGAALVADRICWQYMSRHCTRMLANARHMVAGAGKQRLVISTALNTLREAVGLRLPMRSGGGGNKSRAARPARFAAAAAAATHETAGAGAAAEEAMQELLLVRYCECSAAYKASSVPCILLRAWQPVGCMAARRHDMQHIC